MELSGICSSGLRALLILVNIHFLSEMKELSVALLVVIGDPKGRESHLLLGSTRALACG